MTLSAADRLAILDVITRADDAASRRDADAYVELFTEDAVLDGTQGRHAGRDALRAAVGPVWAAEGPATLHLTLNPVIEPGLSGDQATARSRRLRDRADGSGARQRRPSVAVRSRAHAPDLGARKVLLGVALVSWPERGPATPSDP